MFKSMLKKQSRVKIVNRIINKSKKTEVRNRKIKKCKEGIMKLFGLLTSGFGLRSSY